MDWLSRATGDRGRVPSMWVEGIFDRIPAAIDHATVDVEVEGDAWSVFMTDVSDALVGDGQRLDGARVHRLLDALAQLHLTFWGERFPALCGLEDRYRLLSFETARRGEHLNSRVAGMITRSWDAFSEVVPRAIAEPILKVVGRPGLLAEQLETCAQTLIHGDVRLSNLGFTNDRVLLIDWGERRGTAPPAVDLVSFLVFDGMQLDLPREEVIAGFRYRLGDRFEERALQLALTAGWSSSEPTWPSPHQRRRDEARVGQERPVVVAGNGGEGARDLVAELRLDLRSAAGGGDPAHPVEQHA